MQRTRTSNRIWKHHLPILLCSMMSIGVLYFTRPYRDPVSRASFATAYPAVVLLLATLFFGPWNVFLKRRNPISSNLRRDFGIWAGVLGIVHSAIGQCVHLRGRPWLYYVYERRAHHAFPVRHDLFGFANLTGLVGALILLMLLITSNDYSLRSLGTPQWKQLQRWNYAACSLAVAHTFAYQISEKKPPSLIATTGVFITITLIVQTEGARRRRQQPVTSGKA